MYSLTRHRFTSSVDAHLWKGPSVVEYETH